MSTHQEAERYLSDLGNGVQALATEAHNRLASLGCDSYVKTIYIGYDINGEMTAALYAHADHLEVALALPEDAEGSLLVDASHLTWRTLPVAAIVRSREELDEFESLVQTAIERVRNQAHDVNRDNDFFIRSRRERQPGRRREH